MIIGSSTPRIYTPPLHDLSDERWSLGHAVIRFAALIGYDLHPWQRWCLIHALETTDDGTLRYRTVLILIPRQNGKTYLSALVILWWLYVLQASLVIGASTNLEAARDVWRAVVQIATASPVLADDITAIKRGNGQTELTLTTGRYKLSPTTSKGPRGMSADLAVVDEIRELHDMDFWAAVKSTTVATQGLIWCISNQGGDSSVVLQKLRDVAINSLGGDPDYDDDLHDSDDRTSLFLAEWSPKPEMDIADEATWAYCNPSYNLSHGPTYQSIRDVYDTTPAASFVTENLCKKVTAVIQPPFGQGNWEYACDDNSMISDAHIGEICWGWDLDVDRRHSSLSVCGLRDDGDWHIELVKEFATLDQALNYLTSAAAKYGGMRVCIQGRGCPASTVAKQIDALDNVTLIQAIGSSLTASCGALYDAIQRTATGAIGGRVYHMTQPDLDVAAIVAAKKELSGGTWVWDRKRTNGCRIDALMSVTLAFAGATGVVTDEYDDDDSDPCVEYRYAGAVEQYRLDTDNAKQTRDDVSSRDVLYIF